MAQTAVPPVVRPPADIESLEYIAHLARVTGAVGDCVNVPFVLTTNTKGEPVLVNGAAKYEIAAVVLANLPLVQPRRDAQLDDAAWAEVMAKAEKARTEAETRIEEIIRRSHCEESDWGGWPEDAQAKGTSYQSSLPCVARLFEPRAKPAKCEAWEQAAEDLAESVEYRLWVRRRLWFRFRDLRSQEDGCERERHLRALVLVRVHRFVVGKSCEWAAKVGGGRTWLNVCLYFSKSQTTQADREEQTGHPGTTTAETHRFNDVPAWERFHPDDLEAGYPAPDEEDQVEAPTLREKVKRCVSRLQGQEKEAFTLLRKGMPHDDIARRLGLTVDAVRTLLQSAYDLVRTCLDS